MAITKLISPSTPNPLPPAGAGGDWDKAMAQLTAVKKLLSGEQMILTQWMNTTTAPSLAEGSYLQHMGAIYVVDTEDYALPALSADGTYYIKLTISGETLIPTFITALTGFSWSAQHNGLYNASDEQVLPYSVIREGSAYGKRKILNPASSPNLFARTDYQGNLYGNSLSLVGNASVNGTLGVTGVATFSNTILDKNGKEVLALNIQTAKTTGSFTTGAGTDQTVTASFTFSSTIKGLLFAEIAPTISGSYYYEKLLSDYSISGSTITLTFKLDFGNTGQPVTYTIMCTCATD